MRRVLPILTILVVAASLGFPQSGKWMKSYEEAMAKAKAQNRLTMIFFHADWCTYCQKMKATTFQSARVWKSLGKVAPVMLNIDKEGAKIKQKLGVKVFPAFVFMAPDGTKFAEMNGFVAATMFADEVEKYAAAYQAQPSLLAAFGKNPKDGEANARLAWLYAIRRQESQALKHLADARRAGYKGSYMASAYNMVGDVFQLSERIETATRYFKLAIDVSQNTQDLSYAYVSLFSCYSISGDKKSARLYGEKLLNLKGANKEYVDFVREEMVKRGIKD